MKYRISSTWEKIIRDPDGNISRGDRKYIYLAVTIHGANAEEAEAVFDLYEDYFVRYEAEYVGRGNCDTDLDNGDHAESFAFKRIEGWVGSIKEDVAEHCRDLKKIVAHYDSIAAARADLEEIGNHRDFDEYLASQEAANNTNEPEEEKTMKYEISFIRNNVNQCNIYEARTEEAAQAYFAERKPDATICGIVEHRGSIKPGMPVVIVPAEWERRYWDEISSRVFSAVTNTFRCLESAGVISDLEIEPIPAQPQEEPAAEPDPDEITINDLHEDLNLGNYGEYLNDYRDSSAYICDAIMEIADNHTSLYYSDIMRFISDNPESLAEVIEEGLYDPSHDYDLYKHGQAAEFMLIERDLYEHLADALFLAALDFIRYDLERETIPGDLADLIREWCDEADNNDRLSFIPNSIREYFEQQEGDEE
jgi:hypothetical protein